VCGSCTYRTTQKQHWERREGKVQRGFFAIIIAPRLYNNPQKRELYIFHPSYFFIRRINIGAGKSVFEAPDARL